MSLAKKRRVRALQIALAAILVTGMTLLPRGAASQDKSAEVLLGARLFHEDRFSSPAGDLNNSCSSCHHFDEDPQGLRAHTDFFARSWVPWRAADPRRDGLRNSPTILDAALMPSLHFDGEFRSLEDLVRGTLAGRPMGWLDGERDRAFNRVYSVVVGQVAGASGSTENYAAEFESVYGVDIGALRRDQVVEMVVRALASYLRTLRTTRSTPYDSFVRENGLSEGPAPGESPQLFATRLNEQISSLERQRRLSLPAGFDSSALAGLKIFLRTNGPAGAGNCVSCHTPPLFTDFSFHNIGISQAEYDQVHGEGSFIALSIPDAAQAIRPARQFREVPSRQRPGYADLGYWNFVDLKASTIRRPNETGDRFLRRMIATFKTPTLRNLAFSQPYMHNGAYATIDDAIREIARLAELGRQRRLREPDEELLQIRLGESDRAPLAAFLNTLNENLKQSR
jgi:cytochrome c peroxidase